MSGFTPRARKRAVAAIPVFALAATGLVSFGASTAVAAESPVSPPVISDSEYYMNYVAPRAEAAFGTDEEVGVDIAGKAVAGSEAAVDADAAIAKADALDRKFGQGNPIAAQGLAKLESKSIETGKSPKEIKQKQLKQSKTTQEAKLLTILVEFDENANDDFTEHVRADRVRRDGLQARRGAERAAAQQHPEPRRLRPRRQQLDVGRGLLVGALQQDALHRRGHHRARAHRPHRPRRQARLRHLGLHDEGHVRGDVARRLHRAPARRPRGSRCRTPRRTTARASASRTRRASTRPARSRTCRATPTTRSARASCPSTRLRRSPTAQPDFPWADYDIEDQGDRDGDGNVLEPDGVIDHVVLVHAGEDKSGGGGAEGTYALWAHSSAVAGGAAIPGTDLKLSNYIVQPEDSGVGVFAHEYGHDLGLPDLYDTSGVGDSDVDFWDLMRSGSHSGPIFQSMPTHMGLWDKWVLGWADPVERQRRRRHDDRQGRPDLAAEEGHRRTASRSTCPTRWSPSPSRTAARTCGTPGPTRTGPTCAWAAPSRTFPPTPSSGCGTTT